MLANLPVEILTRGQFSIIGSWKLDASASLVLVGTPPNEPGVYVFAMDGIAQYVGVASANLAKRLYFYRKPSPTQRTNIRMNAALREALARGSEIDIYIATPPALEWNGWPISGPEGLEASIIKTYALPWNVRGAASSVTSVSVPAHAAESEPPGEVVSPTEPVALHGMRPPHSSIAVEQFAPPRLNSGGKYSALCDFLRSSRQDKVSMTFARIEQLVGPLPKSAILHRAWWANHEGNSQAKGWMPASFLAEPDPPHRTVVFRRYS